jgi:hypothetical protein
MNDDDDEKRRFRRQVRIAATVYVLVEAAMILAFVLSYRK